MMDYIFGVISTDPVPNSAGNKMTAFHLIAEGSHLKKFG